MWSPCAQRHCFLRNGLEATWADAFDHPVQGALSQSLRPERGRLDSGGAEVVATASFAFATRCPGGTEQGRGRGQPLPPLWFVCEDLGFCRELGNIFRSQFWGRWAVPFWGPPFSKCNENKQRAKGGPNLGVARRPPKWAPVPGCEGKAKATATCLRQVARDPEGNV